MNESGNLDLDDVIGDCPAQAAVSSSNRISNMGVGGMLLGRDFLRGHMDQVLCTEYFGC